MIKVAQIINTHGLKGECKLYLVTDDPQHRFEKGRVLHLEDGHTLTVVRYREQKGFGYCYFEGTVSEEKRSEWIANRDAMLRALHAYDDVEGDGIKNLTFDSIKKFETISVPKRTGKMVPESPNLKQIGNIPAPYPQKRTFSISPRMTA